MMMENKPLQCLFKMLYAKVQIPSDATVLRDVKEKIDIAKAGPCLPFGSLFAQRSEAF